MKLLKTCLVVSLLTVSAFAAHAQAAVYLMGSAGHLSGYPVTAFSSSGSATTTNNSSLTAYGGTAGIYDNFLRLGPVKLGADIRGFAQTSSSKYSSNGNKLRGALVGLRLAGSAPLVPFKPYIQAEVGGGSTNFGVNSSNTGGFIYQVQLGADFTIFPHLDARGEYGIGQLVNFAGLGTSQSYALQQFGAGLVVRF